jgi:site-specific DNA-cytosine methylase
VKPRDATLGSPVELLWASPDCTHFSIAKGNVPRRQDIRSLADVVIDWARDVRPRMIFLENVQEFQGWGPLGADGRPDKSRKGEDFRRWVGALQALGYAVEWRVLDSSQYGTITRRRRLFRSRAPMGARSRGLLRRTAPAKVRCTPRPSASIGRCRVRRSSSVPSRSPKKPTGASRRGSGSTSSNAPRPSS